MSSLFNGYLSLQVTDSSGAVAPITLAQVKDWGRIQHSSEDALIQEVIDEVIDEVENKYSLPLKSKDITATWSMYSKEVILPYTPLYSITSVKSISTDGTEKTLVENEDYTLSGNILFFEYRPYYNDKLVVEYVSKWDNVPKGLVLALRKAIFTNLEDRQDTVGGMTIVEIPDSSSKKFKQYMSFA